MQIFLIEAFYILFKYYHLFSFYIGLDPCGPNFPETLYLDERLDASDAEFVEVMHCNAGDSEPFRKHLNQDQF